MSTSLTPAPGQANAGMEIKDIHGWLCPLCLAWMEPSFLPHVSGDMRYFWDVVSRNRVDMLGGGVMRGSDNILKLREEIIRRGDNLLKNASGSLRRLSGLSLQVKASVRTCTQTKVVVLRASHTNTFERAVGHSVDAKQGGFPH
jgi:hypothetical protein